MNDWEMTSEHVRAARMLLRWEQKNLAKRSGVSLPTIKRLEAKPGPLGAYASTLAAIRAAFEDEGIEFFNGEAPGVRLHRRPKRVQPSRRKLIELRDPVGPDHHRLAVNREAMSFELRGDGRYGREPIGPVNGIAARCKRSSSGPRSNAR